MYVIANPEEAKRLLEQSLSDVRRLLEGHKKRHQSTVKAVQVIAFYNGQINAYEHALEIVEGLQRGQNAGALI